MDTAVRPGGAAGAFLETGSWTWGPGLPLSRFGGVLESSEWLSVSGQLPRHDLSLDLSKRPLVFGVARASSSCLRLRNPWSTAGEWTPTNTGSATTATGPSSSCAPPSHVRLLRKPIQPFRNHACPHRVSSFSQQLWPVAVKAAALPGDSGSHGDHEPDCRTVMVTAGALRCTACDVLCPALPLLDPGIMRE